MKTKESRIELEKSRGPRDQKVGREVENLSLLKTLLCYAAILNERLKPTLSGTSELMLSLPRERLFTEYSSNNILKMKVK